MNKELKHTLGFNFLIFFPKVHHWKERRDTETTGSGYQNYNQHSQTRSRGSNRLEIITVFSVILQFITPQALRWSTKCSVDVYGNGKLWLCLRWHRLMWCTFGWGFVQCVLCAVLSVRLCLFCGFAVITGLHRAAVASAVTRVEVLIESFRRKQPFTHFLSFALNHPRIQEGFKRFTEEVLDQCAQVGSRLSIAKLS